MVCLRKLPLRKLPVYALAQYLGGFVASLFIWLIYMGKGLEQRASKPGTFLLSGLRICVNVEEAVLRSPSPIDPVCVCVCVCACVCVCVCVCVVCVCV